MTEQKQKLNVAIVGGGIAGTLTARVLREHHNVTIYERSPTQNETGAALSIGPNGIKILDSLGFNREKARCLPCKTIRMFDKQGNMTFEKQPEYAKDFGADWMFLHRSDLRDELVRLATAPDLPGTPANIRWNSKVVNVEPDKGIITLVDGKVIQADLIVAADGIKSVLRPYVVGEAAFDTAKPSGQSAFRMMIGADKIQKVLGTIPQTLDASQGANMITHFSLDQFRRAIVSYACRDFQELNLVAVCSDELLSQGSTESWVTPGDRDELLSIFADFPADILDLLRLGEDIKLWQLRDQDPLPSYVRGRTVLIGDAAHAMTPHQGQGATQSIEDAEGFRLFLDPRISPALVPQVLQDFDAVRRHRASKIQMDTKIVRSSMVAEDIVKHVKYNYTYPGIVEGLARVKAGQPVVPF